MRYAPATPTTAELAAEYQLTNMERQAVQARRQRISAALGMPGKRLVALIGPCALTDSPDQLRAESAALQALEDECEGLTGGERRNGWKPRSNPADPHGLEVSDPRTTYRLTVQSAKQGGRVAMEFGYLDHAVRHAPHTAFGWLGARAIRDRRLALDIARVDRSIPLGVKNGEDGQIREALATVRAIDNVRQGVGAPAVLIYRGGTNALDPHTWRDNYLRAWEETEGELIADVAHWSMRAHNPDGDPSKKTVDGQRAAFENLTLLAIEGYAPAGVLVEASDTPSTVDPHMPYQEGLDWVRTLHDVVKDAQFAKV